jgi:hypothetical protein
MARVRPRPDRTNRHGAVHTGIRDRDDLVVRRDANRAQCQLERVRAAGNADAMRDATEFGELRLEGGHVSAEYERSRADDLVKRGAQLRNVGLVVPPQIVQRDMHVRGNVMRKVGSRL